MKTDCMPFARQNGSGWQSEKETGYLQAMPVLISPEFWAHVGLLKDIVVSIVSQRDHRLVYVVFPVLISHGEENLPSSKQIGVRPFKLRVSVGRRYTFLTRSSPNALMTHCSMIFSLCTLKALG